MADRRAAPPRLSNVFDPWNSSSTGHQRSDGRTPTAGTGWRRERNVKMNSQFRGEAAPPPPRPTDGGLPSRSVADMLIRPGSMRQGQQGQSKQTPSVPRQTAAPPKQQQKPAEVQMDKSSSTDKSKDDKKANPGIFSGVVVYVNGSTYPLISDHRLKRVLADNGGQLSLHLGRRAVTHVVLGRSAGGAGRGGCGGGLAGGKMQREISRVGGCAVKYVGVEWILESLAAGVRLPEAAFASKVTPRTQGSVYDLYRKTSD